MSILPIEVIERVLGFLHGWHEIPYDCAILCGAWLPHLLRSLQPHAHPRSQRFQLVRRSIARPTADMALRCCRFPHRQVVAGTWIPSPPFVLGRRFSHLSILMIDAMGPRPTLPHMALVTGCLQFAHVVELHLYFCVFRRSAVSIILDAARDPAAERFATAISRALTGALLGPVQHQNGHLDQLLCAPFPRVERELVDDVWKLLAALSRRGIELRVQCSFTRYVDGDTSDDNADLADKRSANTSDKTFMSRDIAST